MRNFHKSSTIILCFLLASCGFELQDTSLLSSKLGTTYIQTNDPYSLFYKTLKKTMKSNGFLISDNKVGASTILILNEDEFLERVITVSSSNYPKEYEVRLLVKWSLIHQNQTVIESMQFTQGQDYSFDQNQLLGKVNESDFIKQALAEQLTEKIFLRINEVL